MFYQNDRNCSLVAQLHSEESASTWFPQLVLLKPLEFRHTCIQLNKSAFPEQQCRMWNLNIPHLFFLLNKGTNGMGKAGDDSGSEEVMTPKNKKATTTPQTFPKANKKVPWLWNDL